MFDFQTTTIINSLKDSNQNDTFKVVGTKENASLYLNKGVRISRKYVIKPIRYAKFEAPAKDKLEITLSEIAGKANYWRLFLDLRLEGSNNFLFANDLIYKNKPLYIEFVTKSSDTVKIVADTIKNNIKRYMLSLYDTNLLKITDDRVSSGDPSTLTIEATNEFIRFHKIVLEKFENKSFVDSGITGKYTRGTLGNGSYTQLIRDVQLPTDANVRYKRLYEDEVPIMNGEYDQYIITMSVPRTSITGQGAVGQLLNSKTTHVFWVLKGAVSTAFKAAVDKIDPAVPVTASTMATNAKKDSKQVQDVQNTDSVDNK